MNRLVVLVLLAASAALAHRPDTDLHLGTRQMHQICYGKDMVERMRESAQECRRCDWGSDRCGLLEPDGFCLVKATMSEIRSKMCVFERLGWATEYDINKTAILDDLSDTNVADLPDNVPFHLETILESCDALAPIIATNSLFTLFKNIKGRFEMDRSKGLDRELDINAAYDRWCSGLQSEENMCCEGFKCGMCNCYPSCPNGGMSRDPVCLLERYEELCDHQKTIIHEALLPLSALRCVRTVVDRGCQEFVEEQLLGLDGMIGDMF